MTQDYGFLTITIISKGGGKGGAGRAEAPPDFKVMLLCVQAVTAKGCPKFIIIEKQGGKKTAFRL